MYLKNILSIVAILQIAVVPLCWSIFVQKWHQLNRYQRIYIEPRYKYNWFQASDECSQKGLSLITIDNAEKSNAVKRVMQKVFGRSRNLWIDGNDLGSEGSFVWSVTGTPFEFTNWANRPDNFRGREDCVHIHANSNYEWNDGECIQKMGFICEESERNQGEDYEE